MGNRKILCASINGLSAVATRMIPANTSDEEIFSFFEHSLSYGGVIHEGKSGDLGIVCLDDYQIHRGPKDKLPPNVLAIVQHIFSKETDPNIIAILPRLDKKE